MNLTSAAIEAAAKAFAAEADPCGDWDKQVDAYHVVYRERVTRILEAAAPHMRLDRHPQRTEWPDIPRVQS